MNTQTPIRVKTTGLHGIICYSDTPAEFPALLAAGFKPNKLRDGTPIVESFIFSGNPDRAEKAGIISIPN